MNSYVQFFSGIESQFFNKFLFMFSFHKCNLIAVYLQQKQTFFLNATPVFVLTSKTCVFSWPLSFIFIFFLIFFLSNSQSLFIEFCHISLYHFDPLPDLWCFAFPGNIFRHTHNIWNWHYFLELALQTIDFANEHI